MTQKELILSYFKKNANRDIPHAEVVDWAVVEWGRIASKVFRDPDRAIRNLHSDGLLIKVDKGVYRYDPNYAKENIQPNFTSQQKEEIFKRDGYKCAVCGLGRRDGLEIHADHIRPRALDGQSILENGQTLCAKHNFRKQKFKQTETGKKMFINLHRLAVTEGDEEMKKFCEHVLEVYGEHDINGHITWKPK